MKYIIMRRDDLLYFLMKKISYILWLAIGVYVIVD